MICASGTGLVSKKRFIYPVCVRLKVVMLMHRHILIICDEPASILLEDAPANSPADLGLKQLFAF